MLIEITEADANEILNCIQWSLNEGFGSAAEDDSLRQKIYMAFPNLAPEQVPA